MFKSKKQMIFEKYEWFAEVLQVINADRKEKGPGPVSFRGTYHNYLYKYQRLFTHFVQQI